MIRGIALCLVYALAELAMAVPVEDFFRDPEFKEVTLSPRGDYFTVAVPKGDRTYLVVMRTRDKKVVSSWTSAATVMPRTCAGWGTSVSS